MTQQEFHELMTSGDLNGVRASLTNNPSLGAMRDENGLSPIMKAIYYSKPEIVDLLIDSGIELDVFEAAAAGRIDRLRHLIASDPSLVNAYSQDGFFPLGLAAFFGHEETAMFLIENGADVNLAAKNAMKVTTLHAAAAANQTNVARAILERGADANAKQMMDYTALHEAAGGGKLELAALLLDHGADVSSRNSEGKTPLDLSVEKNQAEMVAFLREREGGK